MRGGGDKMFQWRLTMTVESLQPLVFYTCLPVARMFDNFQQMHYWKYIKHLKNGVIWSSNICQFLQTGTQQQNDLNGKQQYWIEEVNSLKMLIYLAYIFHVEILCMFTQKWALLCLMGLAFRWFVGLTPVCSSLPRCRESVVIATHLLFEIRKLEVGREHNFNSLFSLGDFAEAGVRLTLLQALVNPVKHYTSP